MDDKLIKLKEFYASHKRLPTYTEMLEIFQVKSRNAVHYIIQKLEEQDVIQKEENGRISPTEGFFALPMLGFIQAGSPTSHGDYANESVSLDQYLVPHPGFTYLLRVTGDSMIEEGIREGDLVIVDRKREAKTGDIVAAFVDNEWTVKYLDRKNGSVYLRPANRNYKPIKPREELTIGGVVVKVIKEYY